MTIKTKPEIKSFILGYATAMASLPHDDVEESDALNKLFRLLDEQLPKGWITYDLDAINREERGQWYLKFEVIEGTKLDAIYQRGKRRACIEVDVPAFWDDEGTWPDEDEDDI
jgi:hypothetical protein